MSTVLEFVKRTLFFYLRENQLTIEVITGTPTNSVPTKGVKHGDSTGINRSDSTNAINKRAKVPIERMAQSFGSLSPKKEVMI